MKLILLVALPLVSALSRAPSTNSAVTVIDDVFAWYNYSFVAYKGSSNRCVVQSNRPDSNNTDLSKVLKLVPCNQPGINLRANLFSFSNMVFNITGGLQMLRPPVNSEPFIRIRKVLSNDTFAIQRSRFTFMEDRVLRTATDSLNGCVGESIRYPGYLIWLNGPNRPLIKQGKCLTFIAKKF